MVLILALLLSILIGFLFWFVGHTIRKELKISEDNHLLASLINICLGTSSFLITINLTSRIFKDFNIGLVITLLVIAFIVVWQFKELAQVCTNLKEFFVKDNLNKFIKETTGRYFWILLGVINFIYALIAFSTTKLDRFGLGNKHVFNIYQIIAGTYPPKYSCLPNLDQKYHYGADVLGAILTKFSGAHPEISLDILTLIFLNLSFLVFYALTIKFTNSNSINKYLVPFAAFLAWGPIINLFGKNPGEPIPQKLIEKVQYLTQTRLIDSANWSGLVLHWFFAPSIGIGVFFFVTAIYLLFRFFEGERNLKFIFLLGTLLSSFVIIDFSKFVILIIGIVFYILFTTNPLIDEIEKEKQAEFIQLLKAVGLLLLVTIVFGFIHGNFLAFNKNYAPLVTFYNFGTSNLDKQFGPLKTNIVLLVIYIFGYYQAYKLKLNWTLFLIPFFAASLVISYFVSIPNQGIGKIIMNCNLLGAFSLPLALNYLQKQFKLEEKNNLAAFYTLVFIVLSISTLMYIVFGDKVKPIFVNEGGKFKYAGAQVFPFQEYKDDFAFIKHLRSKNIKDKVIVSEPQYLEFISANTGLFNFLHVSDIEKENPTKTEALDSNNFKLYTSFSLDSNFWNTQKIHWLYLTPKVFRYMMPPEARRRFLQAYLNRGVKLSLSNKKYEELFLLKELYEIDPKSLTRKEGIANNNATLQLINSVGNKNLSYLKQISLCPYFGIYNAKSNDFDGDKIADIAFFDPDKKIFHIIHGKDGKEEDIDLNKNIFADYNGIDLFTPIPSDYDGDSKTDIAFFNETNGTWCILRSSDSLVDKSKRFGVYLEEIPLPADLDGDLKADTSCYNSSHGTWYTAATSIGFLTNNFGLTPLDIPLFSDIDGDSKADYIIYKPQDSRFDVYLSSKNYSGQDFLQVNIGEKTSRVVLEDYDGDKKVDLATWTPESGKWEIAYAVGCGGGTLNCAIHSFQLGKPGDIPMPGDYNGDGRAEIAVYHPDTSELEILSSIVENKKIDLSKYKDMVPVSFIGI